MIVRKRFNQKNEFDASLFFTVSHFDVAEEVAEKRSTHRIESDSPHVRTMCKSDLSPCFRAQIASIELRMASEWSEYDGAQTLKRK